MVDVGLEVKLPIPMEEWLERYGLEAQNLSLDQILPKIGFLQSKDYVKPLQRTVFSQYADGLFIQHQDSAGRIYNLCNATCSSLASIEDRLQEHLTRLKSRYEWLNSDSRSTFGVIYEKNIVILADSCSEDNAQLKSFLQVLTSTVKEQLASKDKKLNLIMCTEGIQKWRDELTECTQENIMDAIHWVNQTETQKTSFKTNVIEGLIRAMAHSDAGAVYVLAHKEDTLRMYDTFLDKVSHSLIPVHIVALDCESARAMNQYQALAAASGGRFFSANSRRKNPLLSSYSSINSLKSQSAVSQSTGYSTPHSKPANNILSRPQSAASSVSMKPELPSFVSSDVMLLLDEIEHTRNTLAEIQALRLEAGQAKGDTYTKPSEEEVNFDSLTSKQWLEIHGLKARKLLHTDLVYSLAFHHCNGMVQIPVPRNKHEIQPVEMVPQTRVVHAQYCRDFVHVRLNGKDTFHVQMVPRKHKIYEQKLEDLCKKCIDRLAWLREGSRELFGTLLEDKIVVIIDTSSSLKERLELIKEKVQQLIEEQISQKKEFTMVQFNSDVHPWRAGLVPTLAQNLEAVGQWVNGLQADGTTNTQHALEMAMSVRDVEGVYLLTDGRPDQPPEQILARVQQLPKVPVHTISFNCADSHANAFLAQLAKNTCGRYYYFSDDADDPDGPKSYKSEDMQLLEGELEMAREQLHLSKQLLNECVLARRRKKSREEQEKSNSSLQVMCRKSKKSGKARKSKLMSSKRWLDKNSLDALGLNLTDGIGLGRSAHKTPSQPHFNPLLPLAHVTNSEKVTIIHPNGTDFSDYERKLDKQINILYSRLASLALESIPGPTRSGLAMELDIPDEKLACADTYIQHRDKLRAIASSRLRPQEDFNALEDQIKQANNFKTYLSAMKEEIQNRNAKMKLSTAEVRGLVDFSSPLLKAMSAALPGSPQRSTRPNTRLSHSEKPSRIVRSQYSKGQKVVVKSDDDGFYYQGVVYQVPTSKQIQVELSDKHVLTADEKDIISMGGAEPCPTLVLEDTVLARVRTHSGPHINPDTGSCDYYIPGIICKVPDDHRKGRASFSVVVFNGKTINTPRRSIIKISKSKYIELSKYIKGKILQHQDDKDSISDQSSCSTVTLSQVSLRTKSRTSSVKSPYAASTNTCSHSTTTRTGSCSSTRTASRSSTRTVSCSSTRTASRSSARTGSDSFFSSKHKSKSRSSISNSQYEQRSQTPISTNSCCSNSRKLTHASKSSISASQIIKSHPTGKKLSLSSGSMSDLRQLMKMNKVQEALLTQQSKELSVMRNTNEMFEKDLITRMEEIERRILKPPESATERKQEFSEEYDGIPKLLSHDNDNKELLHKKKSISFPPLAEPSSSWIAAYLSPAAVSNDQPFSNKVLKETETVECAVNTDAWTEDKGVGTGPLMESRAVETEWTESGLESTTEVESSPSIKDSSHITEVPLLDLKGNLTQDISFKSEDVPSQFPGYEAMNDHDEVGGSQDPLVQKHILARWPDDGWYYRGVVKLALSDMYYEVVDATHDSEVIHARDIIIDELDASKTLEVNERVVALHPNFNLSYAPGIITGILNNGLHFTVELYDGTKVLLLRHDVYHLEPVKYRSDVQYLRQREAEWLGKAVIAKRNRDGFYLPGRVEKQLENSRFVIRRADNTYEEQDIIHMFGGLTKKRSFRKNDHALALAMPAQGICMPGTIRALVNGKLQVEFCDGQISLVNPVQCFWLSSEYFQDAVEFLAMNVTSTSTLHSSMLQAYHTSEANNPPSEYSAGLSNK